MSVGYGDDGHASGKAGGDTRLRIFDNCAVLRFYAEEFGGAKEYVRSGFAMFDVGACDDNREKAREAVEL